MIVVVHDLSMADESVSVTFGSLRDVKALHRMVMNRKFEGPDDVFFGSPQLAAAQNAVFEALVRAEPQVGWPGGTAPPGSHRSVRNSLPLHGSCHPDHQE